MFNIHFEPSRLGAETRPEIAPNPLVANSRLLLTDYFTGTATFSDGKGVWRTTNIVPRFHLAVWLQDIGRKLQGGLSTSGEYWFTESADEIYFEKVGLKIHIRSTLSDYQFVVLDTEFADCATSFLRESVRAVNRSFPGFAALVVVRQWLADG